LRLLTGSGACTVCSIARGAASPLYIVLKVSYESAFGAMKAMYCDCAEPIEVSLL
jgi:hypothetical protein